MRTVLSNPGITVNYSARAFLVDSAGQKIHQLASGETLRIGDRVLFEFGTHENTDIYWYATGTVWGTPYGYWREGASDPGGSNIVASPKPKNGAPTCSANIADKYTTQAVIEDEHYVPGCKVDGPSCATTPIGGYGDLYAAYSIASPSKNMSTSGAWSGCTDAGNGNKICTVGEGGGSATASLIFASTQSRFYGDMVYNFTSKNFRANDGGYHSGCVDMGVLSPGIIVPEQRIQYSFVVEGREGSSPTTPTLQSGGACVVGQSHTISMLATDPDGDSIRYGIDWNNDGSVDQWAPPSGYVSSGTSQAASRTYSIAGPKTVNVLTQDDSGLTSSWATLSFTCADSATAGLDEGGGDTGGDGGGTFLPPAATLDLRAIPSLVRNGNTTQVNWSATNVTSCTVQGDNGDQWSDTESPIGGETSSPIQGQTRYTLTCIDAEGNTLQQQATVNIIPGFEEV